MAALSGCWWVYYQPLITLTHSSVKLEQALIIALHK